MTSTDKSTKANASSFSAAPETELACVVSHAGDTAGVTYLKEYIQMTKLTGELKVNECDSRGLTPLFFAVASQRLDVVQCLVDHGATVNYRDVNGTTVLFWATGRFANVQVAGYLIEKARASIHIASNSGETALHNAAVHGNVECISLLLKHGADARCADHSGSTPLDVAKNTAVVQLLQKSLRHLDTAANASGSGCEQCGAEVDVLKRCGKCFVIKYCSRDCQISHWKSSHRTSCVGSVVGCPSSSRHGFMSLINMNTLKLHHVVPSDTKSLSAANCRKKKFIVKAQLPISSSDSSLMQTAAHADIMCYNEDRSMTGFVLPSAKGYDELHQKIVEGGFMGVKAFFWAELIFDENSVDGSFRIFHGRCAPYQTW